MNAIVRLNSGNDDPDDELLRKLLDRRPDLIDRVADRIADRVAEQVIAKLTAPDDRQLTLVDTPDLELAPDIDDRTLKFIEQVQRDRPALISGDATVWGTRVVAAAGDASAASAAFSWALSPACPTSFWRDYASPMPPPRDNRGTRSGPIHQLMTEWKASTRQSDAAHRIDEVVSAVQAALRKVRGRDTDQRAVPARRSAHDVLKQREWNSARVIEVITWGLHSRPHWRNTLAGVPAPRTFDKIHGDWAAAGGDLSHLDSDTHRNIEHIVAGWRVYYAQRINAPAVQCSFVSRRNIADCLLGSDGAGEIAVPTLENVVRWLCEPTNDQARYVLNGSNEFPAIAAVRRVIISMTAPQQRRPNQRVADTNHTASGAIQSADVSEV
ncbi:hypothetical protein [Gordonia otitidis]|uniref:Uncharacterized protein n=1 Tax=Gordonia otitidis (strain DSM 44809 / CCUG 52243 / JCM 12355 / NBRC 100426 / IFM 10032) TaxID=1108044 RepID=H5TS81_GORO1|nr:hypothetical protein [Gordonia otitidis]GAB36339.1 hypothetical protein GOOTI_207_00240 [Gordonia otitidis NBRC 100426]